MNQYYINGAHMGYSVPRTRGDEPREEIDKLDKLLRSPHPRG